MAFYLKCSPLSELKKKKIEKEKYQGKFQLYMLKFWDSSCSWICPAHPTAGAARGHRIVLLGVSRVVTYVSEHAPANRGRANVSWLAASRAGVVAHGHICSTESHTAPPFHWKSLCWRQQREIQWN